MEISTGFLFAGLLMTLAGAILIYMSLKADPNELKDEKEGIRYIGPIPIVVNDGRKWIVAALIISGMLIVYLITKSYYPDILGGVF